MSASLKLPVWMSVRDFLAWEPGDGQRYELVDGSGLWLVGSEPGLPSLDLANRLYESGDFAVAAPNWWQPRALK